MAAQAKFAIHIPTHDNLGNQLRDLATAAHHHLFHNAGIEGSFIEAGKKGNWRDDPQETLDHLVMYAPDTPEVESHVKQTAAHIGEIANQWGVTVTKEGKDGPNLWIIDNPKYREGEGADPAALHPGPEPGAYNNGFQFQAPAIDTPVSHFKAAGGDLLSYLRGTSGSTIRDGRTA